MTVMYKPYERLRQRLRSNLNNVYIYTQKFNLFDVDLGFSDFNLVICNI